MRRGSRRLLPAALLAVPLAAHAGTAEVLSGITAVCTAHGIAIPEDPLPEACDWSLDFDACYRALEQRNGESLSEIHRHNQAISARFGQAPEDEIKELPQPAPIPGLAGALPSLLPGAAVAAVQPALGRALDEHTLGGALAGGVPYLTVGDEQGGIFYYFTARGRVFTDPSPRLNPALKQYLVDNHREDFLAAKVDEPRAGDDVLFDVEVMPHFRWLGRDWRWYMEEWNHVTGSIGSAGDAADVKAQMKALEKTLDAPVPPELQPQARRAAACAGEIDRRYQEAIATGVERFKTYRFPVLVANQPQIVYRWRALRRDGVVGANVYSHRLSVSTGILNNVSTLRARGSCGVSGTPDGQCARDYLAVADGFWARWSVAAGAFFEYGNLATFSVDVPAQTGGSLLGGTPAPASTFTLDGGTYRQWGGTVGASVPWCERRSPDEAVLAGCRVEASWQRTTYSESVFRVQNDVARITVTYRRGAVSFPVDLVYRTDTELRADVADPFSIVLGASFGW